MKYIEKKLSNEPKSLKETRSTPGLTYDDCNKADIRKQLVKEQGGLCAYCMRRIKESNTGIEHYDAQSNDAQKQMNYMNMLGVCRVSEGQPKHKQHCDKSRGNQVLTINPLDKNCEKLIQYATDGLIFSENPIINRDLDVVLNLNIERLMDNRAAAIDIAKQSLLQKNKKNTWSKREVLAELKRWQSRENGKYKIFCQVAIFYLENKLARL